MRCVLGLLSLLCFASAQQCTHDQNCTDGETCVPGAYSEQRPDLPGTCTAHRKNCSDDNECAADEWCRAEAKHTGPCNSCGETPTLTPGSDCSESNASFCVFLAEEDDNCGTEQTVDCLENRCSSGLSCAVSRFSGQLAKCRPACQKDEDCGSDRWCEFENPPTPNSDGSCPLGENGGCVDRSFEGQTCGEVKPCLVQLCAEGLACMQETCQTVDTSEPTPAPDSANITFEDETEEKVPIKGASPFKYLGFVVSGSIGLILLAIAAYVGRPGTGKGYGAFRYLLPPTSVAEVKRLICTDMTEVQVTPAEQATLKSVNVDTEFCMQYLCWRRTNVTVSWFFFFAVLIIVAINTDRAGYMTTTVYEEPPLPNNVRLKAHMKDQMASLIPLSQAMVAIVFYGLGAYRWHDLQRSRLLVVVGWVLVFFIPFTYFLVPWMDIDKPADYVKGLCVFLVDQLNSMRFIFHVQYKGIDATPEVMCRGSSYEIAERFSADETVVVNQEAIGGMTMMFIGMSLQYIVYVPFVIAAVNVLKTLAPGVLGILLGLQAGLRVASVNFAGVRLTSWMLIVLQACSIPVVMFLCAMILVVVGTSPATVTGVCLTMSMSLYLVFADSLLSTTRKDETKALMKKIMLIGLALKVVGLACLVVAVLLAPHLTSLSDMGEDAVKNAMKPLTLVQMAVACLAGMFVSKVVFVDVIYYILMSTYVGCLDDDREAKEESMRQMLQLCCAFDEYSGRFNESVLQTKEPRLLSLVGDSGCNLLNASKSTPSSANGSPQDLKFSPAFAHQPANPANAPDGFTIDRLV
ncbi:hypothetical protein DIPPA_05672 [Diplonema papillatum]|nr:hypothetical protein DIPPA_05672 [Diplonema papillatum]